MKQKLVFLLTALLCLTTCSDKRILQGYDDPLCSEWSDDGLICEKCAERTYRNAQQNKCLKVDDSCKTWSQTNGECLTCYDGYGNAQREGNAIDGLCPVWNGTQPVFEYDVNCKCYTDDKECIVCYRLYYFNEEGKCTPNPQGCLLFENNTCLVCLEGYFLDSQGECNPLPQNCVQTDSEGICTQCATGYFLISNNTCVELPANCEFVNDDGQCINCRPGYFLDEDGDCNLLPDFCNATDNEGRCIQCEYGYFLSEAFECEALPENCFFTDINGICTQCVDGYYLDFNKECQLLPQNCLEADEEGSCTVCKDGYRRSGGECVRLGPVGSVNPDCSQQDDQGQCIKCRNFYELKDGQCVPTGQNPFCKPGSCECGTGKCQQCMQGYFLDNHQICIAIGKNCKQYSRLNGLCTSCHENYEIVDGQCVPAKQNVTCNLNCKEQTDNGTCTSCRKYYTLENGDCVPNGENPKCHSWSKSKVCQRCYYPYIYYLDNNNICQRRNQNCFLFNPQDGQCVTCPENYELEDGECLESSNVQTSQKK